MCNIIIATLLCINFSTSLSFHKGLNFKNAPLNHRNLGLSTRPTSYDKIPVFYVSRNKAKMMRIHDNKEYLYFMDFEDSYNVLLECSLGQKKEPKIMGMNAISLKDWYRKVDPSKERIKSYTLPNLLPSKNQVYQLCRKLRREKEDTVDPIPVYYSSLITGTKGPKLLSKFKNRERILYYFNHDDLMEAISRIEDKIKRELAIREVKVVSLMELLKGEDREDLLFVMSSRNLPFISFFSRDKTPSLL